MTLQPIGSPRLALLSVICLVALGCSQQCDMDCSAPSVGMIIEDLPEAVSAVICLDEDCQTVDVVALSASEHSDIRGSADRDIDWRQDTSVDLSIELVDSSGARLASIAEERSMREPGSCTCAGFGYRFRDGELSRER